MENSERYEALSPTEIAALKKRSSNSLSLIILMVVVLIGVAAWAAWASSWVNLIIILVIGLLAIRFVSTEPLRSFQSLNRDVREGKKKIVVAQVEGQRQDIRQTGGGGDIVDNALGADSTTMSYSYLVKVRGKEFKVSENQYYKCKPGRLVEMHLAPHSEHVFFLKALED